MGKSSANLTTLGVGPLNIIQDVDGDVKLEALEDYLKLSIDGSEKLRVISDGKVGIGIAAPDAGNNYCTGKVQSFDAGGFTIAWTKVGTPRSVNVVVLYTAFK